MADTKTTAYPLRITDGQARKIQSVKRKSGLTGAAVMRLAMDIGMPLVEARVRAMRKGANQ